MNMNDRHELEANLILFGGLCTVFIVLATFTFQHLLNTQDELQTQVHKLQERVDNLEEQKLK